MHKIKYFFSPVVLLLLILSACSSGSPDTDSSVGTSGPDDNSGSPNSNNNTALNCASPLPMEVQEHTVTSNLPNSYDQARTDDATESDSTTFFVSVFLPERCPENRFPVVIESHGYSGSRDSTADDDGEVDPEKEHFPAIDELFAGLSHHGYVGVSYEQRGHGDSIPENGGGYSRVMDPEAETQDAIALLDWIYENRDSFQVGAEDSGIANDFTVGLIGYSFGGGFQFPLALLDERIDAIVPNGTWHSLINSLLPGDAVKNSFDALLCLLADTGGVVNTPAVARMCELLGTTSLEAGNIRTRADLVDALGEDGFTEDEVIELFNRHVRHFQLREAAAEPWCTPGDTGCTSTGEAFTSRPVPFLLLQGNRDVIFNMTEAYWNWSYFNQAAGGNADVSVLTTEGAHMNPLVNQVEGSANCGQLIGVDLVKAWFDFHLKGLDTELYQSIPKVCISVADTEDAHNAAPAGLVLNDFPVGSQAAPGGVPARLDSMSVDVLATTTDFVFAPVITITGDNKILAGIPSIESITVTDTDEGDALDVTAVAYFGVGIQRGGDMILVDDQVTALVEGTHTSNPNIENAEYLLAGVGERLQDGDQVGLLFYQRHAQYSAAISASSVGGATGIVGFVTGVELPPLLTALDPVTGIVNSPNPYQVDAMGVELPIIDLDSHPDAVLSQ